MENTSEKDIFGGGFDLTASFDDVPTVEYTGIGEGEHLFLVVPTPKRDKVTNEILKFPIKDRDGKKLEKETPQMALNMFCLDEGKVEIIPVVDKENKTIGYEFAIPDSGRGVLHVSFMNDDNMKVAFKKNNIRDGLKMVHPKTGGLDYGQLIGAIISVKLVKNKDYKKPGSDEIIPGKGFDLDYDVSKILRSNYHCKNQKNPEGVLEPSGLMLESIPAKFAVDLYQQYNDLKIKRKQEEDAGTSFNPDEFVSAPAESNGTSSVSEKPW